MYKQSRKEMFLAATLCLIDLSLPCGKKKYRGVTTNLPDCSLYRKAVLILTPVRRVPAEGILGAS